MSPFKEYSLFLGCVIPSFQPYVESSTRKVSSKLKFKVHDIEGVTCCPAPEVIESIEEKLWYYIAGRNLALAEALKHDLVTICNGCFETLTKANDILKKDAKMREKVNSILRNLNVEFKGIIESKNILEVLHDDIGLEKIKSKVVFPLKNINVAIQYGCRLYKYEERNLTLKFYRLVQALGCNIVKYDSEKLCCGLPAMHGNKEFAYTQRSKRKVNDMLKAGADCAITLCPSCLNQLEMVQLELKEESITQSLPCLNLLELMALAFGFNPKEIGILYHRIKPMNLLEKIKKGDQIA
ncbi:MAG: heterodisulfide reductase-related iron-sulfur binding cluster [Candidatus Bathyarchaeia archaeon]